MQGRATTDTTSRANVALGVAALGVLLYVIAIVLDDADGEWLWPLAALVGGVGAVMGWLAGRPRPHGRALAAVILGALVFLAIVGWIIVAAATGNM